MKKIIALIVVSAMVFWFYFDVKHFGWNPKTTQVDTILYLDSTGYEDLIQTCDSEICENIRLRKLLGDTLANHRQTHFNAN